MTSSDSNNGDPALVSSNDLSRGAVLASYRTEILELTNYLEALCARLHRLTSGQTQIECIEPSIPDEEE